MPHSEVPSGTSNSTYGMPTRIAPNRAGSGVCTRMRLPQGQIVSTPSLLSQKPNLVPSRYLRTPDRRRSRASRSGITSAVVPRTTCGVAGSADGTGRGRH